MESSGQNADQHLVGEEFSRGSTYTEPRTVTLDTKLQGVPTLDIWNGYAVMIRNRDGNRQVIEGPTTVLLDYSQTLEVIELSTGKPKNTDNLLRTVYLRTKNNFVTDEVGVETSDKVKVRVKIQLKGDFTGDPNKWFDVENYVKQSCDHVRSVLKGKTRSVTVAEFYAKPEDFIRDAILGESKKGLRKGMFFEQFGFKITDVEVLEVEIKDAKVRDLLDANQHEVVESNLRIAREQRELEVTKELESIQQKDQQVRQQTLVLGIALQEEADRITHETVVAEQQRKAQIATSNAQIALANAVSRTEQEIKLMEPSLAREYAKIEQSRVRQDLALTRLTAETQAAVDKAKAITPELAYALQEFVTAKKMGDLVKNFGEMASVKGLGTLAAAQQVLDFLPENALRVQEVQETKK
jgi:major vault protein